MQKSIQITSIIVVGLIIISVLGFFSLGNSSENTVTVQGQGQVKAVPDLVGVYFNVQANAKTSGEATQKNSELVELLKTEIKKLGFEEKEIQTQGFNVYQDIDWVNGRQIEKGYIATHSIRLEISTEESSKIGEVIDAGITSGVGISYINFELSQELQNKYKAEALKLAAQDARIKAEAVAEGFNKKIGKLVSTSVDDYGYYPFRAYDYAEGATTSQVKESATSIIPSEQDISASVSAIYRI